MWIVFIFTSEKYRVYTGALASPPPEKESWGVGMVLPKY